MKVFYIMSRDDMESGQVTTMYPMPDGADEKHLFLAWLRKNNDYFAEVEDDQECLDEAEYVYSWCEVKEIDFLENK